MKKSIYLKFNIGVETYKNFELPSILKDSSLGENGWVFDKIDVFLFPSSNTLSFSINSLSSDLYLREVYFSFFSRHPFDIHTTKDSDSEFIDKVLKFGKLDEAVSLKHLYHFGIEIIYQKIAFKDGHLGLLVALYSHLTHTFVGYFYKDFNDLNTDNGLWFSEFLANISISPSFVMRFYFKDQSFLNIRCDMHSQNIEFVECGFEDSQGLILFQSDIFKQKLGFIFEQNNLACRYSFLNYLKKLL